MSNVKKDPDYLSITKVAYLIEVSPQTIKRWYYFWENKNFEKPSELILPPYHFLDKRNTKYFHKSDIPALARFGHLIRTQYRGVMSEYNAVTSWGERGKENLLRKGKNFDDSKLKFY